MDTSSSSASIAMTTAFDAAARDYDELFTRSQIGRAQREVVWSFLNKIIPTDQSIDILEINAGTGEDAVHLASLGHHVLATDSSEEMLLKGKLKSENRANKPRFQGLDLSNNASWPDQKFDLVFSNFGGLNCLSPTQLSSTLNQVSNVLVPGGSFVAVIMPRFCLMESLYFLVTFQWAAIFRRRSKQPQKANLGTTSVDTWYYGRKSFQHPDFNRITSLGVGIFIPPSYLENKWKAYPAIASLLLRLDHWFRPFSVSGMFSDHLLLHLKKKS